MIDTAPDANAPEPSRHAASGPASGSWGGVVWLNGQFVARDAARISAFDAGVQHAVGLFETMVAVGDRVFRIDRHLARLAASARELGLTEALRTDPLREAVERTVHRNALPSSRVRLTITGGDLNLLQSAGRSSHDPTIMIVAQPRTVYPDRLFEEGAMVTVADPRANPLDPDAGHKTLNYWPRIRALQHAARAGASEALWMSVTNHLASGSVSNVLLVRDGTLLTPYARGEEVAGALPAPVLPGIVRDFVIETAGSIDMPVERRMLSVGDALEADEILLTNSSWGVLPVVRLEAAKIGAGAPGPVARRMRSAWLAAIGESRKDGS